MSRAASLLHQQHLFYEQDHGAAIIPDPSQEDLGRRYDAASDTVKALYNDYMFHLKNLTDAIKKRATYPEQMEKFQIQRHAKDAYEHALKIFQQIPYREFAHHGM